MRVSRSRGIEGAMASATKRHLGQSPHQRAVGSCSLNALLQLVTTSSYAVNRAYSCAMCSSDSDRRSEKYGSVSPAWAVTAARRSPSASTPLDHWWLIG